LRIAALLALTACSLRDPPSPVKPAQPLPADPPIQLASMDVECDGLLAALATYRECQYHDDDDRESVTAWIEVAKRNLDAGRKAKPEANAQQAIAGACHRATSSVKAANERCLAGPKPKE
jgi:hypothetical protein